MPRTTLLSLVSDYYVVCSARLAELNKKQSQDKTNEPLDVKCNTVRNRIRTNEMFYFYGGIRSFDTINIRLICNNSISC